MNILSRLKRVTVAHIESLLNSVEDAELLYPQLVKEMEDQVRSATEAEAKAMAFVKGAEREVKDLRTKRDRFQKGAQMAMDRNDEATAREALAAQVESEEMLVRKEEALAHAQEALTQGREARKQMQAQLDELRTKKDEILARSRVAKNQKKVLKTVHGPVSSARSILDAAAKMEAQVEQTEAELDVQKDMAGDKRGPSLDQRLKDLEKGSTIDDRLAALRKKPDPSKP